MNLPTNKTNRTSFSWGNANARKILCNDQPI